MFAAEFRLPSWFNTTGNKDGRTDFGVSKALFHEAATLTLNVTDPFNAQQTGYDVLANGINSTNLDKIESRFVKLNFSYKFGNQRVKASQRRRTGTETEQGRMEN